MKFSLFLVFIPFILFSKSIEFYGTVLDSSSNEPLVGVNIFNEKLGIGTTSNEQGYFFISLKNVKSDSVPFIFQYIGYKTKKILVGTKKKYCVVKMSPILLEGNEIRVLGSKYQSNLSFKFISPLEIKHGFTFLEPDVFRYLTTQAGVNFSDDISDRIYVRGFRSDKLLILFDDFVLYNPYHLLNITSSIDVESIKAIEFYKSIYPVNHSGRVGGLLKLYSKTGNQNHFNIGLDASLISTILRLEGPIPKGSYFVSLRKTYVDFITRLFSSDEFPYSFYDGIVNIRFNINNKNKLKISGIFNRDYYNHNKSNPSDWANQAFGLNWDTYISEYFYFHQNAYFSRYYSKFLPDSLKHIRNEVNDFSYRFDAFINLTQKIFLNFGLHLNRYQLDFNTNDLPLMIFSEKEQALLSNVYVSIKYKPLTNAEIVFGNALNYLNRTKRIDFQPLLRFKYLFANGTNFELGMARKSQYLFTVNNEKDMFPPFNIWRIIPDELAPETSDQFAMGIRKQSKNITLNTEIYYNYLSKIIDFNRHHLKPTDKKFNKNKGESYGLEASLNYDYKFLSLDVSYSLSKTIYTLEKNKTYYPSFHRLNKLDINLFLKKGNKWRIGVHWVYASGRPFTGTLGFYPVNDFISWAYRLKEENYEIPHPFFGYMNAQYEIYYSKINQMHYPDYHRLDLHIERFLSKKIRFYMDIINVYNRRNVLYYDYDIYQNKKKIVRMLPILPSLGISVKFR